MSALNVTIYHDRLGKVLVAYIYAEDKDAPLAQYNVTYDEHFGHARDFAEAASMAQCWAKGAMAAVGVVRQRTGLDQDLTLGDRWVTNELKAMGELEMNHNPDTLPSHLIEAVKADQLEALNAYCRRLNLRYQTLVFEVLPYDAHSWGIWQGDDFIVLNKEELK